ncbi:hypothetical protein OSTOST_15393 [Ostertagia ostertagi]
MTVFCCPAIVEKVKLADNALSDSFEHKCYLRGFLAMEREFYSDKGRDLKNVKEKRWNDVDCKTMLAKFVCKKSNGRTAFRFRNEKRNGMPMNPAEFAATEPSTVQHMP